MSAVGRMVMLDLRTVLPYRAAGLAVFVLMVVIFTNRPVVLVPAVVLFFVSMVAAAPFQVGDKAGLETLYEILPVSRRSVLAGHYGWALACFAAATSVATPIALAVARVQHSVYSAHDLGTVLTVSWALFAVSVGIQFPLLVRFGYTRASTLGTTLPMALVVLGSVRLHLSLTSVEQWLPLAWPAGAAVLLASAAVTMATGRRSPTAPRPASSR